MEGLDKTRALEVLLGLTRQLGEQHGLVEALQRVTDASLELLPADHGSVRVLDGAGRELLSGARSGAGASNAPMRHERGVGVSGWVVEHGQVARIDDARSDDRFVKKLEQGFSIRSILAVPLWSAGHVIGVLSVSSGEPARFGEADELLASLLANCAVPPIERARLARLAMTDAHTKAYNQGYLITGLRAEMEKLLGGAGNLSLLLLDLDHFKDVNDTHGHAAGDQALREFADRVRSCTREKDVLVRRGGDEFVLIMPGAGRDSALGIAERIRAALDESSVVLPNGQAVRLSVSVGAATWDGVESAEDLERRADEAMYAVKQSGRDGIRYFDEQDGPVSVHDFPIPPSSRRR